MRRKSIIAIVFTAMVLPAACADSEVADKDPDVTAYAVAYHWSYALFDEDGVEVEMLEVPEGAVVEIVAVNDHASDAIAKLPSPVAEAIEAVDWSMRAQQDVAEGIMPDPEDRGMTVEEALHEAHDHGADLGDHGLIVAGSGAGTIYLDDHAHDPERMVFVAGESGNTYEFVCDVQCGWGHQFQRREMISVI